MEIWLWKRKHGQISRFDMLPIILVFGGGFLVVVLVWFCLKSLFIETNSLFLGHFQISVDPAFLS